MMGMFGRHDSPLIIFMMVVWTSAMFFMFTGGFSVFSDNESYDEDCLAKIAKDVCNDFRMNYDKEYIFTDTFKCDFKSSSDRTIVGDKSYIKFEFTDKEKGKCEE